MILIVTSELERTTDEVIKWLLKYKTPFIRISANNKIKIRNLKLISEGDIDFSLIIDDDIDIKFTEISCYWYRRDNFLFTYHESEYNNSKDSLAEQINYFLEAEAKTFNELINYLLKFKKSINSFYDNQINKLLALQHASFLGIIIPKTFIFNNTKDLLQQLKETPKLITKGASQGGYIGNKVEEINSLTVEITKEDVKYLKKNYFPTLFQEALDKKYELRIFYFKMQFFSSAIFSQSSTKTKVDFRNYDSTLPNRVVNYSLPQGLQEKLQALMDKLELTSGSIDIVVTKQKQYVFLEVNPIGQFQQVSYPCNLFLERHIAQYLTRQFNNANEKK